MPCKGADGYGFTLSSKVRIFSNLPRCPIVNLYAIAILASVNWLFDQGKGMLGDVQ